MSKKRKLIKREETISKLATLQSRKAFRDVYKEIDNLEEKVENGVGGIASIQTSNTGNVKFTGDGTAENPLKAEANVEVNIASITTTQTAEQLNALADGLYFANGAGVYNISVPNPTTGVTVANGKTTVESGYSVSFNKKGSIWSLVSVVNLNNGVEEITNTIGVTTPNSGNNSTAANRNRLDLKHPIKHESLSEVLINQVQVYCNVGGIGKIKFCQKVTDTTYNIVHEVSHDFVVGLNTIVINKKIPTNTYVCFYSSNAAFSVSDGTGNNSMYLNNTELIGSSQVLTNTTAIIQFNVEYTYFVENNSSPIVNEASSTEKGISRPDNTTLKVADGVMSVIPLTTTKNTINGVTTPGTASANTESNRTRLDRKYPINVEGQASLRVNQVQVYCNVGGVGKIKFCQKVTDTTYNVVKEFTHTFVAGLNTINLTDFEIPNNCFFAFYSATANIAVGNGVDGDSYRFNSIELVNNTQVGVLANATMQFNVSFSYDYNLNGNLLKVDNILNTGILNSDMYYKYNASTQIFNIYAKQSGNIYINHTIKRETDMSELEYKDIWRYFGCVESVLNDKGEFVDSIILYTPQESEFVYRRDSSKVDFTGGYHGDEIFQSVKFLVDNLLINITSSIPLTACKSFKYICKSTLHETANTGNIVVDGHPIEANHIKVTEITTKGFSCYNEIEWLKEIYITQYYSGIACIHRNISKNAYNNVNYTIIDLDSDDNNLLNGVFNEYFNYNEVSKWSLKINSSEIQEAPFKLTVTVRDNGAPQQYKKFYKGQDINKTTVIGEKWRTITKHSFFKK